MKDFVQWTTPSPLWEKAISNSTAASRRAELSRPAILRFATDSFMEDFLKMAENDPKRLDQYLALPETWRGISPMPEALNPAPAFARNFKRLGLISARKKAKKNGLTETSNKFTEFADSNTGKPLKLYQPAHQRFYMISACLVCERPGLPDKIPNSGREEKVSYVIRRMFPKDGDDDPTKPLPPPNADYEEYAYVITDQGARWKKVSNKNALEKDEEQQALFSVDILEDDGRRRKIFSGMIPTGRREAYIAAGKFTEEAAADTNDPNAPEDPNAPLDSRIYTMRSQFRDPWRNLLQTAGQAKKAHTNSTSDDSDDADEIAAAKEDILKNAREQIQTISWLILLDFAEFLQKTTPNVWKYLSDPSVSLSSSETALKNAIVNTVLNQTFINDLNASESTFLKNTDYPKEFVLGSLKDALLKITGTNPKTGNKYADDLESVGISYVRKTPDDKFPDFLFPLADPVFNLQTNLGSGTVQIIPTDFSDLVNGFAGEKVVCDFAALFKPIFKSLPNTQPLQMPPIASQKPMDMREGWFVIRCVYERPLCGAIDPPVLSEPTKAFQIAGFFDPDAPARPIRIALPIDTTPAGLRKFDRNTAFMMSDLLCGQVNRMKGITFADLVLSVLPFPFHKGLDVPDSGGCKDGSLSVGMMCSLSIPIITICALILLMIIVALLDFIFKWLPFLIFCFPLPGLKAKNE
jgi:hypothetical protein